MRRYMFIILVIVMMGVIFLFSSCDASTSASQSQAIVDLVSKIIPTNSFIIRKLAHFSLFATMTIIVYNVCSVFNIKYNSIISFIFVSLYAILDEIHQYFIPGRSCEIRDILIDVSGVITALIIIKIWRYIYAKRTENNGKNC